MRALFVSPHPDDIALSCGGLILSLLSAEHEIDIVTLFSGCGAHERLTPYQQLALGFGAQDRWVAEPSDRHADPAEAGAATAADAHAASHGPVPTPAEVMQLRREEDRAYARLLGVNIVHLDLPDAVFRDYVGDEQLLGAPRADDPTPVAELRAVVRDLRPDRFNVPLGVGGHVDHRLARRASMALVRGDDVDPTILRFYEDFPYAYNLGFSDPGQLDEEFREQVDGVPEVGRGEFEPLFVRIADFLDRKIDGLEAYPSQLGRLFGGEGPMARAVREQAERLGKQVGLDAAERYWRFAGRADRIRAATSS